MEKAVKTKGISGSDLKYIAILMMLIDHVAWLFLPTDTVAAQVMHFFGRITAPVMAYFITEGYHYTKNLKKYIARLAVFAVISHFSYCFCFAGSFFASYTESVIATLLLCLLAVHAVNCEKIPNAYKLVIILVLMKLANKCDWGETLILFTLAFELGRGNQKHQLIAYSAVALMYCSPVLMMFLKGNDLWKCNIYKFGLFLPLLLIQLYNGEKGGGKMSKWFFYIFYPLHLLILGAISYYYG